MNAKLDFLDALRGYAILGVVLTHSTQKIENLPIWVDNFGVQGARGVQLFFLVSAFTLFYSLYKKYNTHQLEVGDFFVKRFFRIAPMFYAALIFYAVVDFAFYKVGLIDTPQVYSVGLIFSTLTFTSLLNPDWLFSLVPGGWSISAEMIFYLLVPLLFLFIRNLRSALILFFASILIFLLSTFLVVELEFWGGRNELVDKFLFYWFPSQLPIFSLGIVLFFILKEKIINGNLNNSSTAFSHFLIVGSILMIVILGITRDFDSIYFQKHFLFGIAFLLLAYGLGTIQKHFLVNKIISFIGQVSFSMYLIHFFVLDVVIKILRMTISVYVSNFIFLMLLFLITLIISTLASYLAHKLIESPGIMLGRKVSVKLKSKKKLKAARVIE
ncbi:acyltransferase family protein [Planococcus sp. X10-3]|uniref:acyltransferase family protein n=1 Tax=Planococcus sp. X10-3 TaxID=3061240 RepID=UPI003BB15A4D